MNYYYDILINLNENKALEFYEWQKDDPIENVRKAPIFRVDTKVIKDVLKYKVKFSESVLDAVYLKTEIIENNESKNIDYMLILTDTKNALIVELNSLGEVICLSKTIISDEVNLIEIANAFREQKIEYEKLEKRVLDKELRIEKDIKHFLLCELNSLKDNNNYEKLRYLYYEWTNELEEDFNKIYNDLVKLVKGEFNFKHRYIYDLVKLTYQKSRLSS